MKAPSPDLSPRARDIARATLDQLQAADELGGCETIEDYLALMDSLIAVLQGRRTVAAHRDDLPVTSSIRLLNEPVLETSSYGW